MTLKKNANINEINYLLGLAPKPIDITTPPEKKFNNVLKTAVSNELNEIQTNMESLLKICSDSAQSIRIYKLENDNYFEI